MKTLYIECSMGAAGDMLTAALYELLPADAQCDFLARMNALGLLGVAIAAERSVKCGITGTHMQVTVNNQEEESHDVHGHEHFHEHHEHGHGHHHEHTSLATIDHILSHMDLPQKVKTDISEVYRLIAEAESKVHGQPVEQIHFHEVGSMDAIADITGVSLLITMLAPEKITVSPVTTGFGHVHCAHGILPVPAPATAHILQGIPFLAGNISGELCTPTGAALLKYFADDFGEMPVMTVNAIGYGMGKKDFEKANCVRAMFGETADSKDTDSVIELACNLDDMTAEQIGFAMDQLLLAGALDVFTTPIGMKKNRPATMLTCLCREADREVVIGEMFRHTTTLGIRENICRRYTLTREIREVSTTLGKVRVKESEGYGVKRSKPEYDDLTRIAAEKGLSLEEVSALIRKEL